MTKKDVKKRNAEQSKARILSAGKKCFAEMGYSQAGIRDIAREADVSTTLLLRYFGSKAGLFEAALIDALKFDNLPEYKRDELGVRLVEFFQDKNLEIYQPAIISLSLSHPEARDIISRVVEQYSLQPLAKWLGGTDSQIRALEIMMLAISFVQYTRQLPLTPLTRGADKKLGKWLAESIQAIVDN